MMVATRIGLAGQNVTKHVERARNSEQDSVPIPHPLMVAVTAVGMAQTRMCRTVTRDHAKVSILVFRQLRP